jgi:hypothetical protein
MAWACSTTRAANPILRPDRAEEAPEAEWKTVNSTDYQAVVKAYTNKKGELSYELLNKTLIKAARSNPYVADLVAQKVPEQEISDHVVKANFEAVTGNRSISLAEVHAILELLDAVSPRSVLAELHGEIQSMLAEARR